MKLVEFVFGTRPEAIKLAPVILEAASNGLITSVVYINQQVGYMVEDVVKLFGLEDVGFFYRAILPLDLERSDQAAVFGAILNQYSNLLDRDSSSLPKLVVVQGDTVTSCAVAFAAYLKQIPVAHVEAGLRTGDKYSPFPEEIYRTITDSIADLCFAPTIRAFDKIHGKVFGEVYKVGNTIVDAINIAINSMQGDSTMLNLVTNNIPYVLVTAHRRENYMDGSIKTIAEAVRELATECEQKFLWIKHPNPFVHAQVQEVLNNVVNVIMLQPVKYFDFVFLMENAYFIMSDSGGIQEEVTVLRKPLLILRNKTERPEALSFRNAIKLCSTNKQTIKTFAREWLLYKDKYRKAIDSFSNIASPFGDGNSAKEIVTDIKSFLLLGTTKIAVS